ncbi:hypothetical protein C8R43DRAFT_1136389 [Mycena crocata]|nr:hypothetical protein C8R43DRAFT_1136389 [Mycena crocata]
MATKRICVVESVPDAEASVLASFERELQASHGNCPLGRFSLFEDFITSKRSPGADKRAVTPPQWESTSSATPFWTRVLFCRSYTSYWCWGVSTSAARTGISGGPPAAATRNGETVLFLEDVMSALPRIAEVFVRENPISIARVRTPAIINYNPIHPFETLSFPSPLDCFSA